MSENISKYVKSAKEGNQYAFTKLFELTKQSAYYTALKITKKQQDAEDIVQEAYIKAFLSLDSLADDNRFESWFNCIVANKCKDLLKKKKPDLFSSFETDDSDIVFEDTLENKDFSLLPESVTENEATRKLVMECIEKLPDEQRTCVVMFYYDELSIKEIAQALNIPEGTVKSRLNKARATLKAEFENIEKRDKIKLHALPFVPLVRWAFQNPAQSDRATKLILQRILKNVLKALADSGKIATGIKAITTATVVKIISVAVAVSVAVTAAAFGVKAFVDNKNADEKTLNTPTNSVSAELTNESEKSYYDESPLAVHSGDGETLYFVSDDGIVKNTKDGKTEIISKAVPENLVFYNTLMYLFNGALYSYDGTAEQKIQNAGGSLLYEYNNKMLTISADRKNAYKIDTNSQTSERLNIKGNYLNFIEGYVYYYDGGDNLCRMSADDDKKEVVVSKEYTKGFRSAYCVQNGNIYFSGFDSDENGTIYTSSLGSNAVSEIKLDDDGIQDFTVIDKTIYYSTYKGRFYRKALNGSSELLSKKNCYNVCSSGAYALWADMDSGEVFVLKADGSDMQKTNLPNTVTSFEIIDNIIYYSTSSAHGTMTLSIGA